MKNSTENYTLPVLKKGTPVTSIPKNSSTKKEQAKKNWYVEFYFKHPVSGKMVRQMQTGGINRIKDPVKKELEANQFLYDLTEELKVGYTPYSTNEDLKRDMIALDVKQAIINYFDYHTAKGSRAKTIVSFRTKMRMLEDFFGSDKKITDITTVDVTNLMLHYEKKQGWSGKTFSNSKFIFVNFFNYLVSVGRIEKSPFDKFKEKRKVEQSEAHKIFSDEDFILIKNWLQENDPYCYFCIQMIYYTCIRPFELLQLETKYIDVVNKKMTIPASISKNKKTETLALDQALVNELLKLDLNSGKFLIGDSKNIVGNTSYGQKVIYNRFVKALDALKLKGKGYTLYSAKHLSNVRKYLSGKWSLNQIRIANRHSTIEQTETYLRNLIHIPVEQQTVPEM